MANRGEAFLARLRQGEVLVFDGAMGTMLFAAGLTDGACPELWNATHPDVVRGIHQGYFEAGSDFVETNTFGGTRLKLAAYGLQKRTRELNVLGARLAREVCPPEGFVAGSIGPTGHLPDWFAPLGDVSEQALLDSFREQAEALAEGGADLFAVETMMYPEEAILAIRAAKEATGFPVMCTMFFQFERDKGRDRTMWGTSPEEAAKVLLEAGADVVGMNCGDGGPGRAAAIVRAMRSVTDAPLIAYPNAGLPIVHKDGRTTYELSAEEMVKGYPAILEAGANVVGGCCGTSPAHLALISALVKAGR